MTNQAAARQPDPVGNLSVLRKPSLPPHAPIAEEDVLGGVMLDPENWEVVSGLTEAHFYIPANQLLFRAIQKCMSKFRRADFTAVAEILGGNLDDVGGLNRLVDLAEAAISSSDFRAATQILHEKLFRRNLAKFGKQIELAALDEEGVEVERLPTLATQSLSPILSSHGQGFPSVEEDAVRAYAQMQAVWDGYSGCIPTGDSYLDQWLYGRGWSPALNVIGGASSMGKTDFSINVARWLAEMGYGIAYFSLEMEAGDIRNRLAASRTGIPSYMFAAQEDFMRLSGAAQEKLHAEFASQAELPLRITDKSGLTAAQVCAQVLQVKSEFEAAGIPFGGCVLDHLQYMPEVRGSGDARQDITISNITLQFKTVAKEGHFPFFLLSQLKRGVESRNNKRPTGDDLFGASAIKTDAEVVMLLYRDEYYNPDSPDKGFAELIFDKQRKGRTGTARMVYSPECSRFSICPSSVRS